jgi:hypothetical protein
MGTAIPTLWTPQDVGLWLTIPTERVIRMARQGRLPCITLPDGEVVFDAAQLVAWLNARRQEVNCAD